MMWTKSLNLSFSIAVLGIAALARAQAPLSPATQPVLPSGHPDISQMAKPSAPVALPAGHPDISQMKAPTTQQAINGTLSVRAIQGTKDGPAIGADPFVVEFYVQGQLLDKIEAKLDEHGTTSVGGVPLNLNPQPVVKVTHAGVEYQTVGQAMSGSTPVQELQVPVYETTDKAPDWKVRMRHVMVERAEGGLQVMEMLAVDNPTDRTWLGNPIADGKHAIYSLVLPASAQQIQLLGEHGCCAKIDGTKLTNTMPLVPGTSQHQISYLLPANGGKAEITVSSPVSVDRLMVFVPDDGTSVAAEGLESGGSSDMGTGKTRFYKASAVPADKQVKLAISGIVATVAKNTSTAASGSTHVAQIVAGLGAVVILLFGIAFLFMKAPKKA